MFLRKANHHIRINFINSILQSTLSILKLSDNLFGDSLNPIFSTAEFRPLNQLRILDLSGNKIKALEEGIFKGCEKLQVSYLSYFLK